MTNLNKRLQDLETELDKTNGNGRDHHEPTKEELRTDFIITLRNKARRTLAYYLPSEVCHRFIDYINYLEQPWMPELKDELTPEDWEQINDICWTSRLFLVSSLELIKAGVIEDTPPELADILQARIIDLIADDTPDLARTSSEIYPWQMAWPELLEKQRAAGYGVYGPKPGCTDNQNGRGRLSIEFYWTSQVRTWLKYYDNQAVKEFINLKTIQDLED